jgi:hypothetical protein
MVRTLGLFLLGFLGWAEPMRGQPPSASDGAAIVERARQKAFSYTQSLPDFVCAQTVHRYGARGSGRWFPLDTLSVKLSYLQHAEVHKLMLIDGRPTDESYEGLRGATSSGEFGEILRIVFAPDSRAAFDWKSWKNVRQHRTAIFDYAVSAANSPEVLEYQGRKAVVGIYGVVEIDLESGEVLHLTYLCYEIPKELGLTSASTTVDYDFADVGGRTYLLPARSETELHSPRESTWNKMEYRDYHKFSTDSTVDFGPVK